MNFWLIDSFSNEPFTGNPAAVVILPRFPDAHRMQAIAAELNQSETAFVERDPARDKNDPTPLRWFTPKSEIDLCGHATLAAAHALLAEPGAHSNQVVFQTQQAGILTVAALPGGTYEMDFPSRPGSEARIDEIPAWARRALGLTDPIAVRLARDWMLVYETAEEIRAMQPDFSILMNLDRWVIVTAPADAGSPGADFVSRFFCAGDGIDEDPVTGSAHCTLAPYWSERLGKGSMAARQISARGGWIGLTMAGDRVQISGAATTVLRGQLEFV